MRSVFACVFELPDGEHVIATGPVKRERAVRNFAQWFARNPEAKWNPEKVIPVTKAELDELTKSIAAKYPRRRPLKAIFEGVAMKAFEQGFRVPGSTQKRPAWMAPPVDPAWGKLAQW